MQIGFIGLGRMGSQMCGHLLQADYAVAAYDVRPEAVQAIVERGARSCGSPAEPASGADIVFTSLPHPDISREVIIGANGRYPRSLPAPRITSTRWPWPKDTGHWSMPR